MDERWPEVVRAFDPQTLRIPEVGSFKLDLGVYLLKLGVPTGRSITFPECFLQDLGKVSDDLFTGCASMAVNGEDELIVSFDFSPSVLEQMLKPLPNEEVATIRNALRSQPFLVQLRGKVVVQLRASRLQHRMQFPRSTTSELVYVRSSPQPRQIRKKL